MPVSFKGAQFPQDIILMGGRWYVASPLSYRHVEDLMEERGVSVDHATVQRWVVKYSPPVEAAFPRRKRPVGRSGRLDETYIRINGEWRDRYRAVDKHGQTSDLRLTERRDQEAARQLLKKAIRRGGVPAQITIDGSAANEVAIKRYHEAHGTPIIIRQVKSLHKIIEQDHRSGKRVTRPMFGFQALDAAQGTLAGSELMHLLKKGQLVGEDAVEGLTPTEQFSALAA